MKCALVVLLAAAALFGAPASDVADADATYFPCEALKTRLAKSGAGIASVETQKSMRDIAVEEMFCGAVGKFGG